MKNKDVKRLLTVVAMSTAFSNALVGCGSANVVSNTNVENVGIESTEDTKETETGESKVEGELEITYTEGEDVYTVDREFVKYFDREDIDFVHTDNAYSGSGTILNSIDIYGLDGFYAGYTKEDARVSFYLINGNSDWVIVAFAKNSFAVRADDFNANFVNNEDMKDEMYAEMKEIYADDEEVDTAKEADSTTKENNATESDSAAPIENAAPNTAAETTQAENSTPATTTYSEEEVISIVENALRDAGCRKPEEDMTAEELAMFGPTDGMGWGIEDIPMNDPYTAASKVVEGFQFAGWKFYYIENQGSSNGYVHLKLYSG